MNDLIFQAVKALNPWIDGFPKNEWISAKLPERYVERELSFEKNPARASLVVGPRQSGKSTLVWKTLGAMDGTVLFCNCEEPVMREWLRSPALFFSDLKSVGLKPDSIFLDEAQWLEEAGLFVKGLVDFKTGSNVFVTGSSSYHLESKTRESLAGRAERHLLLPFSLRELLRAGLAHDTEDTPALRSDLVKKALLYGGYPAAFFSKNSATELSRLADSIIVRDASDRFRIKNIPAFRKLLSLAAGQTGNLVNFSEWGSRVGISNDTVADYVNILEETHIVRLARPYMGRKRAEITATPKIYFLDNGIRNALWGGFDSPDSRRDLGALAENLVFSELAKRSNPLLEPVGFWRTKAGAEVDFVVERKGRLIGIEVKAGDSKGNVSKACRSFMDAYRPAKLVIVGSRGHLPHTIGDTLVTFVAFEDLFDGAWLELD